MNKRLKLDNVKCYDYCQHEKLHGKEKKKWCFSPHKNVIFLGRSVIFPGVLGEEYSGSEINFFRQAPTCDWKIVQSSDGKCVHQNSVNKFVPS